MVPGKKRGEKEWTCPCTRRTIKEKEFGEAIKNARAECEGKFDLTTFVQAKHRESAPHLKAIEDRKYMRRDREKVREDKGKKHSKMADSRLGKRGLGRAPRKGKSLTEEQKKKRRENASKLGRPPSDELTNKAVKGSADDLDIGFVK